MAVPANKANMQSVQVYRDMFGNMWIEILDGKNKQTIIVPPRLIDEMATQFLCNWSPDTEITIKPVGSQARKPQRDHDAETSSIDDIPRQNATNSAGGGFE